MTDSTASSDRNQSVNRPGITLFRIAFYIGVIAYVSFLLFTGRNFGWEEKLFPYLIGIPAILISIAHVVTLLFPSLEDRFRTDTDKDDSFTDSIDSDSENGGRTPADKQRYAIIMLVWVVLLPISVYYLGFFYALPLYVFAFLRYFRDSLTEAFLITVVFSIVMYVLFVVILGMQPWTGVLQLPDLFVGLPR